MAIGERWTGPKTSTTTCSYCGAQCADSFFSANSIDQKSSMCGECIERYALLSRLGKLRMMYSLSEGKWRAFFKLIERETSGIKATPQVRAKALYLVKLLVRRCSSVVAGFRNEGYKTDPNNPAINLDQPKLRVTLNKSEIKQFCKIVKKGLAFAGMPTIVTDIEQTNQSLNEAVLENAMQDVNLMEHVCVIATDGERDFGTPGPMIFIIK